MDAEKAAVARQRAEAEQQATEAHVLFEKKDAKDRLKAIQEKIDLEVKTRAQKLKEHDHKMAQAEKAMEEKIKSLDEQSTKTDELLAEQLKRIANNKAQITKMDQQAERREQLSDEGKVVAEHIKAKNEAGHGKLMAEINDANLDLEDQQDKIPKLTAELERLKDAPTEIRAKSKRLQDVAVAEEEKATLAKKELKNMEEAQAEHKHGCSRPRRRNKPSLMSEIL